MSGSCIQRTYEKLQDVLHMEERDISKDSLLISFRFAKTSETVTAKTLVVAIVGGVISDL